MGNYVRLASPFPVSYASSLLRAAGKLSILPVFLVATAVPVYAAQPVSYIIAPASGAYAPGSTVSIELSVKSTQAFAGLSVDIGPSNMAYEAFNTANTPAFSFIDYHAQYKDLVVICQNNNCPAGTYKIGTIHFKAGQSGTMGLAITPVETADTNLKPIGADGTSGSYSISGTAASTPGGGTSTTPRRSTYTIPRPTNNTAIVPTEVTEEERQQAATGDYQYVPADGSGNATGQSDKTGGKDFPWLAVGAPILALLMLAAGFMLGKTRRPGGGGYTLGGTTQTLSGNSQEPLHMPPDDGRPPQGPIIG